MKLLLDQHFSNKLVPSLEPIFPGTAHVKSHGLETRDDNTLWEFARAGGFAILTKDEDFQVLSFTRGHPPKVIWLRSGNGPTHQVLTILLRYQQSIEQFGHDEDRSLLILA